MTASQANNSINTNEQQITEQQKAQLNALGICIYEPVEQIGLEGLPWISDVCKLLNISRQNCLFDSSTPIFDPKTQTLHLPAFSYSSEINIKKSIWLTIRPFVA